MLTTGTRRQPGLPLRRKELPKANRRANAALIAILVVLSFVCLLHATYVVSKQMEQQSYHEHAHHVMADHEPKSETPTRLAMEDVFSKSVKSCIPSIQAKCQTYIPEDKPRVAILAPPGEFGEWIFDWVRKVVDTKLGSTVKMDLELVSHVPPYGYGKTHGWTKLIRVLPRSIMLGAADAIRGTLQLGQTQTELTLHDLMAAARQYLRFHCRVSHLAAHTATLTLDMDLLALTPYIASDGVLNFLNITAVLHGEAEQEGIDEIEDSDDESRMSALRDDEIIAMSNNLQSYAASLLTWVARHEHVDVKKTLNAVLKEELELSSNFTKWPCESFWTSGEGPSKTELSDFSRRLAASLSPDCNAKYSSCSVKRDKCEHAGDPECK